MGGSQVTASALMTQGSDYLILVHTDADHETLNGLVLAGRVVRETLRLHPAGVISPREAAAIDDLHAPGSAGNFVMTEGFPPPG